jgi:hypothetical protein
MSDILQNIVEKADAVFGQISGVRADLIKWPGSRPKISLRS